MFDVELEIQLAQANLDCKKCKGYLSVICEKYSQLETENERLKRELKQIEVQGQVVFDGLRKENAKLKCLALHLFERVALKEASEWSEFYDCASLNAKSEMYKNHEERWLRIAKRCNEAYRNAKKALKEGK